MPSRNQPIPRNRPGSNFPSNPRGERPTGDSGFGPRGGYPFEPRAPIITDQPRRPGPIELPPPGRGDRIEPPPGRGDGGGRNRFSSYGQAQDPQFIGMSPDSGNPYSNAQRLSDHYQGDNVRDDYMAQLGQRRQQQYGPSSYGMSGSASSAQGGNSFGASPAQPNMQNQFRQSRQTNNTPFRDRY